MHRSGTSVVTHLINRMGAYFGELDQEMRPSDDNPKGFWERNDIVAINEAILTLSGATWFKLSDFDARQVDLPDTLVQRIESTLSGLSKHSPWVVKDPRNCITFPVWAKFLEAPIVIIPFRSPLEVATSLTKRNSFPIEFSIALWQEYLLSAIKYAKGLPIIFVEYEKLVNAPIEETKVLYQKLVELGVEGLQLPSDLLISDIIDLTLKHEIVDQEKEKGQLTPDQVALLGGLRAKDMDSLEALVNSTNNSENHQILSKWEDKITELLERSIAKGNRITSTLFSSDDKNFFLKNSIRIVQKTEEDNKILRFFVDPSFRLGKKIRVDVVDDISIFQLKSITLSGNHQITIDSATVSSNAFYRIEKYFFFDQIPSSIFFSLPEDFAANGSLQEIIIHIELIGKGVAVLPHVNQFHKNFISYAEKPVEHGPHQMERLIHALTAGKDRALIKAQMRVSNLESNNHHLYQSIQYLQDQNGKQHDLINRLNISLERKDKKSESLAKRNIELSEALKAEKEVQANLNRELELAVAEKDQHSTTINHLTTLLAGKEFLTEQLRSEVTNVRGSFSNQIGRALTLPARVIFDLLTNKKPFNQTRFWWIKQHLLHPRSLLGNKEERKKLKADWLKQSKETAYQYNISAGSAPVIPDSGQWASDLLLQSRDQEVVVPVSENTAVRNRKRILYVSPNLPDYDTSSGGKRATRMLGLLAEEFDVYAFTLGSKPQKYIDELKKSGVIVIRTVDHREIQRKLPQVDTIIYAWYETYFSSAAFRHLYPDAKIIVDSVDVHWVREKRSIGIWEGLTVERVAANQAREMEAYQNADIVWAVTETDKNAILSEIPTADVRVVSNIHELVVSEYTDNQENTLLFIGGYNHYPNVSAVKILAQEIFPKVRNVVPDAKLIIAGANAPKEVKALSEIEGVIFKGFIEEDEIEKLYAQSFLTVSPLLAGAGIKGKICESIVYRTPVVTNIIGNEGINLISGQEGLISTLDQMPVLIIKALKREYDFGAMTGKAQEKLMELVGPKVVKERMVNSILPEISICIVTWNRLDLLRRCIESIEGNTIYPNYKILVHSNGCTDGTQDYLRAAANINPNIIPILSDQNDVFVLPNNWMMERFPENDVVLINNDVYVTKGWLSALHDAAYSSADYGIVGSKILYPDGRLQEFGSELYATGTGRNIGKFDDPDKEEYKKLTEVGYVSGCSMYIKRSTIKIVGMFDEQFHPCYCEDSDYCYTAKENGIKTIVTPNSLIFHDEGGTSGTDTSSGMKRYQVINMEKFLKKHMGKSNGIDWPGYPLVSNGKPDLEKNEPLITSSSYKGLTINFVDSYESYQTYTREMKSEYDRRLKIEERIGDTRETDFQIDGFDLFADTREQIKFRVVKSPKGHINFRESFICEKQHLNSRLRATYAIIEHLMDSDTKLSDDSPVYFTEQSTRFYSLYKKKLKNLVGSEYLGEYQIPGFLNQQGLRHEDLTNLSFEDASFDLVVSLEVLEHIPNFEDAVSEISRVLKPGGYFVFTVPFILTQYKTTVRARVNSVGEIEHLLMPEYHGDPVQEKGILCFYHYGWDLIEEHLAKEGINCKAAFIWSEDYCIFGKDVCIFIGQKM